MEIVQYKKFKENLSDYFDIAVENKEEVFIQNKSKKLVLMDAEEYESIIETLRIYKNPYLYNKIIKAKKSGSTILKNAKSLEDALSEISTKS
jgi:antitoxin YefM